ncbi:DUF1365-domain-containing protein [Daedalea quercina L-15889]|uniref:DUF1365-domain-containing protein n=1 Tax=Daedalea quercina L-15889 TaxID=1314783 RepID=A0A165PDS7_9APHY|nr:DUF1365-domain-containing protein [Daedalea quercina L-15889]
MATTLFVVGAVAAYVGFASGWLRFPVQVEDRDSPTSAGYVLECKVTHRRLLPKTSSHGFAYRTLWLLVSLNALESHSLDLGRGWLFGYGGIFWRLTGLRSSAYLNDSLKSSETRSIRDKLSSLLDDKRHAGDRRSLRDAWMLTMPSFMGFEGINPLTVYYCYDTRDCLFMVVLEVHNTFGERHVYFLDEEMAEKQVLRSGGSRFRWTISKDFHVSPFNTRKGSYVITVLEPSHLSKTALGEHASNTPSPLPYVDIRLQNPSDSPTTSDLAFPTLTATLCATESRPLTVSNLLHYLSRQPFALLSSFLRILYEAWILHYIRRLDVFVRPDPKPAKQVWGDAISPEDTRASMDRGKGVGWQPASRFELYARGLVENFFQRRADELGIHIALVAGNPNEPDMVFSPRSLPSGTSGREDLRIWYLSPLFFSTIFMAPSAELALLLGHHSERIFISSSETVFYAVFNSYPPGSTSSMESVSTRRHLSIMQSIRCCSLPNELLDLAGTIPHTHPLDPSYVETWNLLRHGVYISTFFAQSAVERWLYRLMKARFVPGQEPWLRWQRALEVCKTSSNSSSSAVTTE